MIEKRIFLVLVLLAICVISAPASFSAECTMTECEDSCVITGSFFTNIFVCPYSPDTPITPETPSCPTAIDAGLFSGGPWSFLESKGAVYEDFGMRFADKDFDRWDISFNTEGVCYEGREGEYYTWYQVHITPFPTQTPSDGKCIEKAHSVNWDTEEYCSDGCVGHQVVWKPGATCCGDDDNIGDMTGTDFLDKRGDDLCVNIPTEGWVWYNIDDSIGKIQPLTFLNTSIVSDGSKIWRCTDSAVPHPSSTSLMEGSNFVQYIEKGGVPHAYICFDDGTGKRIAECAGAAYWSSGGVLKSPGESVLDDNTTYYCYYHRESENDATEWRTDLDNIEPVNQEDCSDAKLPNNQDAGYTWTGTKCCSEADDEDEYYNDRGGYNATYPDSGGCWDKTHVLAGMPPPGRTIVDVVNYRGGFEGCNIEDPEVIALEDSHTGEPLVDNNPVCTVLQEGRGPGRHLFCSYSGNWLETDWMPEGGGEFALAMKFDYLGNSTGCCVPDQCWDGEECIDDQTNSSEPITYGGYRCIAGEWDDSQQLKFTWDNTQAGYCPSESQCLANPSPYADVNCISSGGSYSRYYCDNGEWTSRTKMLSLAMLKFANVNSPTQYTLFCDSYEEILGLYDYDVGGDLVLNYMGNVNCQGKPCVNEFCVLRYDDGTAFGATVNEPIDSQKSFLKALDMESTACDSAMIDDNRYHECGSNVWYNHLQGAVVKLPIGTPFGDVDWQTDFQNLIRNPFENIAGWIVPRTTGLEFFNQTRLFTKVYASRSGDKRVFAFLEQGLTVFIDDFPITDVDYFGIEYQGIGVAPCDLIRHYDPTISCSEDQTIFAQARVEGEKNLVDAWPDLTSKLRLG